MKTTIPINFLNINNEGFHLLIEIKINDKPARVIIDTGASRSAFDIKRIKKFIKSPEFKKIDKLSAGLGTNSMESQITKIKKFQIGNLIIKNYQTVVINMSHINQSYKQIKIKPIDGILGSDILSKYNAIIDYKNKVLKLTYGQKT